MIHWTWLILIFTLGVVVGMLIAALLRANDIDEPEEPAVIKVEPTVIKVEISDDHAMLFLSDGSIIKYYLEDQ